jgi:hypothetical protein
MDPRRPKNKSSWNQMKPIPSHQDLHADSGHIFVSENVHRMQKLSRSDRFPKQAKNSKSKSIGQSQN